MSLKEFEKVNPLKEKFPESFEIKKKLYSPLSILHYNLTFHFQDNYPAKMPKDFARDMIELYSTEGDFIFDGCCGSGIVPRIANQMKRNGFGSDINPKAIELCKKLDSQYETRYSVMDSRETSELSHTYHLILSSLPFGLNIIGNKNNYSPNPADISNCSDYNSFFLQAEKIIKNYFDILIPNGVLVLDARDRLHNGKTICLILEFLKIAQKVGFELVTRFYYELIPYRQMTYKHKPSGNLKAMPASTDVIVLTKLEDSKL